MAFVACSNLDGTVCAEALSDDSRSAHICNDSMCRVVRLCYGPNYEVSTLEAGQVKRA
jgi:hypothetical protein